MILLDTMLYISIFANNMGLLYSAEVQRELFGLFGYVEIKISGLLFCLFVVDKDDDPELYIGMGGIHR